MSTRESTPRRSDVFPGATTGRRRSPTTEPPLDQLDGPGSARGGALDVVGVVALDPAHELAQLAAGRLDRVLLALGPQLLELPGAVVLVVDEPLGEGAVPDVGEDRLHVLLHVRVDDPRPGH